MALLYAVDFRTLPNQTIGAAGAYTIDGKTWWAKANLVSGGTTLATNIVNGSGLHWALTAGIGSTDIGAAGSLAFRHMFLPLTEIDGWEASLSYMVRARFAFNGSTSAMSPLIGITSTTSDAVGLTAGQRANEILVAPLPQAGTTASLKYKIGTASALAATGRAGTILNSECVVGVYHFTPRFALLGSEHLASGMPTDPSTWLAVQTVPAADFNGLRTNPGVFVGLDSGNNDWYLQQLRIETIGELLDSGGPTVSLISPPSGNISRHVTIVVRVADTAGIAIVNLWVKYANGITETIYANGEFAPAFGGTDGISTITTIEDGKEYEFSVRRLGGWLAGAMEFFVEPVDTGGNTSAPGGS